MTRGTLVLVEPGRITKSLEFNGDMGVDMDNGMKAMKKMQSVKTYKSFIKLVQDIKSDYGYTDREDVYYPIWDYSLMQLFDMTEGYFDKWFSDYLYIKNISGEKIFIKARTENDNGFELVSLDDGCLGILNYGYYDEDVMIAQNSFELASPEDPLISWAFTYGDSAWYSKEALHRMASVRFHKDDDKTFDYISEGYDIKPGDVVIVRGKGKELKKVHVSSLHWASNDDLEKALPGGISRFKRIEGKAV